MRYLCMGFHNEQAFAAIPPAERDVIIEESLEYEVELRRGGYVLDGLALQSVQSAATLRFSGGKMSVTDGPFAETKEQLGGVLLLEAQDLNHAIQLMSQMPCMRVGGSLEIRPINEEISGNAQRLTQATAEFDS